MPKINEQAVEANVMKEVLDSLKKAQQPYGPRQLIDLLRVQKNLDEWSIRKPIWQLTADAKAELTPDWKLKLRIVDGRRRARSQREEAVPA